jgi:hypothetical protein
MVDSVLDTFDNSPRDYSRCKRLCDRVFDKVRSNFPGSGEMITGIMKDVNATGYMSEFFLIKFGVNPCLLFHKWLLLRVLE